MGNDAEKGLPGLYWMNVLGSRYVDWLGRSRVEQVRATFQELGSDGSVFLQFGEEFSEAETERVAEMQSAAKRVLAEDAFFDI